MRARLIGSVALLFLYAAWPGAQSGNLTVLHVFQPSATPANPTFLTALPDDTMLLTSSGSSWAPPMLARLGRDGGLTVLAQAEASAPLVVGGDGGTYGITAFSDAFSLGRVFRVNSSGGVDTVFAYTGAADSNRAPRWLRRGPDGTLYVSTGRCCVDPLFKVLTIAPDGTVTPDAFVTPGPVLGVQPDGAMVGIRTFGNSNAVIFRRSPDGIVSTVADLGANTFDYSSDLIATSAGAIVGYFEPLGEVSCKLFRVSSQRFEILRTVTTACRRGQLPLRERGPTGDVYAAVANGVWRIAADGTVSSIPLPGGQEAIDAVPLADGSVVALLDGGPYLGGEAIRIPAAGGVPTRLAAFTRGNPDGALPMGPIVQDADGALYGTTASGGTYNCGTIYRVSRTGAFRVLYTFTGGGDGCAPQGLVQTADGAIFGSTRTGTSHAGTLFRVGRSGALITLFVFRRVEDGFWPGPLTVGPDGQLYGRTAEGGLTNPGSPSLGTAFRLSTDGSVSVIHRFTSAEKLPWPENGALLLASDGQLYGTTTGCSNYAGCGDGSLFRLKPDGQVVRIATFAGQEVRENLVQGPDGRLYGTAGSGAFAVTTSGVVTMFRGNRYNVLHARGPDGRLYGQVVNELLGTSMFSMSTDGTMTPVHEVPPLGPRRVSTLIDGRDGSLYGSAEGLSGEAGRLFRLQLLPGVPRAPRNSRIVR